MMEKSVVVLTTLDNTQCMLVMIMATLLLWEHADQLGITVVDKVLSSHIHSMSVASNAAICPNDSP